MKKSELGIPEGGYIDGRYFEGFVSNADFKEIEISIGDDPNQSDDLRGWLKVRISFNACYDLTISDARGEIFIMEECDLGGLARLRDFLNYAISIDYEIKDI